MARLMKVGSNVEEGLIFNKWLDNRMKKNKNVLSAITGATGSSKSYQDLRRAELWYEYKFNKPFPYENICFSVGEVMKRISSGELKKGEIIIFEEAGANLGSLDFQDKVSKLFTYVLQSFRSMNIIVFFNLPFLSMLNKSARMLIHVQFVTCGINHKKKVGKSKGYFLQVNQSTGKVYSKYLRIRVDGRMRTIKRFNYKLPSKDLIKDYETKKKAFLDNLNKGFYMEINQKEKKKLDKLSSEKLQEDIERLYKKGMSVREISKVVGRSPRTVHARLQDTRDLEKEEKARNPEVIPGLWH